jgi:type VI protein secretion system component VasF
MNTSLAEICEPFFLFTCRLSAAARKGVHLDERQIRSQMEQELDELQARAAKAGKSSNLRRQIELVERPLIYFFDSTMARGPLGRNWRELSLERGWRGYEQDFFVLLDETLRENDEEATARLEVFYTCLGLGFEGFFEGQPEKLSEYMNDIARRLRAEGLIDSSFSARLCPEAYENTETGDELIKPVGGTIGGVGIVAAGLVIILFLTIFVGYRVTVDGLRDTLESIVRISGGAAK